MKKTIKRLVLRRDTIRALLDPDLASVVGGANDVSCPETHELSSCSHVQLAAGIQKAKN